MGLQTGRDALRLGDLETVRQHHGGDLGALGQARLVAHDVVLGQQREEGKAGADHAELLPAPAEDAQGLFHQHLGREEADEGARAQRHDHGGGQRAPVQEIAEDGLAQGRRAHEAAADRHAHPEHRAQHRHGHDLACALHIPLFQDRQREQDQQHARRGDRREVAHALHVIVREHGPRLHAPRLRGPREPADVVEHGGQVQEGGEAVQPQAVVGVAVDEIAEQGPRGALRHRGGAAQDQIDRGQDEDVPRQHAAEAGHAVKGRVAQHHEL